MTSPLQYWHISFPVDAGCGDGTKASLQEIASDEQNARILARIHSREHGYATTTNRQGLVATYVAGEERLPKKDLIATQAEEISELIGVDSTAITHDDRGLIIGPNQLEAIKAALLNQGVKKAATMLRAEAERRNQPGPDHSLDMWAVHLASAGYLEGQVA